MKIKEIALSLLFTLVITACASNTSENEIVSLADSMLCCSSFSTFPWVQLGNQEKLNFQINGSSSVGRFDEGNSYFVAFKMPVDAKRAHIRLASNMLNGTVFAPKLIALDKDFNIIEFRELKSFDLRATDAFSRNQYVLNLMLDAKRTPYFVIYTKANEIGKTVQIDHPAKIRAKQFAEPMPMVTDPKYVFSHFGKLSLNFATFTLEEYVTQNDSEKTVIETAATINLVQKNKQFYFDEIDKAVLQGDLSKALDLLDEAKKTNISDVNEHFIKAVRMQ